MNDSINNDDNVDYLESPEIGSIAPGIAEGFKAPIIERPSAGIDTTQVINKVPSAPENTNIDPIRAALLREAERTRAPFDVNPESTAQMMEDNEKALERQQTPVIVVQENPLIAAGRAIVKGLSAILRRR